MNIECRELGPLKHGKLDLNKLTIISGANNSGKTYLSYTLCGFLNLWPNFINLRSLRKSIQHDLLEAGSAFISPKKLLKTAKKALKTGSEAYSKQLHRVLAGNEKHHQNSYFNIELSSLDFFYKHPFKQTVSRGKKALVRISYEGGKDAPIKINLLSDSGADNDQLELVLVALDFLDTYLVEKVFSKLLPEVFIASAERTGATIFQKELDLARNRLIDSIGGDSTPQTHMDFFKIAQQISKDYALPVKMDIDFIRAIESFSKEESELSQTHPDILADFHDIIGGEYKAIKNQGIYFIPKSSRGVRLTMGESSSAVRSMLNIGAFLRHKAAPGQLLIIDEPELNLHPENQRKVARLLARLVNAGIQVFITTHSDYIIKEFNTLIMLSGDASHLKEIKEKEGYQEKELLIPTDLSVYQAGMGAFQYADMARKKRGMTLIPADVNQEEGIWIESFDNQIEEMDRIQSAILYGKSNLSDNHE